MVEIDGAVIRLVREHLPGIAGDAWEDPRATLIIGDGIAYVADAPDAGFDVIIVDSTDPVGVGEALFTDAFYRDCARVLAPGGMVVNQCGVPFMQSEELRQTSERRARFFSHVSAYVAAVPTYVGGFMTLGIRRGSGAGTAFRERDCYARGAGRHSGLDVVLVASSAQCGFCTSAVYFAGFAEIGLAAKRSVAYPPRSQ